METTEQDEPVAEPNAYAPPAPAETLEPQSITSGQRLAGALLILGALLRLAEKLTKPDLSFRWSMLEMFRVRPQAMFLAAVLVTPFVFIVVDIVLGGLLVAKKKRAVRVTAIRLVLGMICFSAVQFYYVREFTFGVAFIAVELLGSAALLLLLGARAERLRLVAGTTLFGMNALLSVWGIGVEVTGINPLGAIVQKGFGNIESEPTETVVGRLVPYKLTLPADQWYVATYTAAVDGEENDRVLMRPNVDAYVTVAVNEVSGMVDVVDEYTDAVVKHYATKSHMLLQSRQPLRTHPEHGRLLQFQDTVKYKPNDSLIGVVTTYGYRYVIHASAPRKVFPELESELRGIIESFELPPAKPLRAPDDCEEQAVTRIEGLARKYVMPAPGEYWFVRKAEAAKKDNPTVDRSLVRPDKGASISIFVEENTNDAVSLEAYTNSVATTIATETNMTLISRETLKSRPGHGRILRAKGHTDGVSYQYLYWIFAKNGYVYQVVGITRWGSWDEFELEFMRSVEQFEAP